ncbi:polygalacturonase-like [Humulus lupulus]|uniref:polygalacturonase-like n=1 Tax=Humulus lupulus TaxID=3486 RepID=UPI002B403F32|nr:polygalacturonase-like [Humulus lupulus]
MMKNYYFSSCLVTILIITATASCLMEWADAAASYNINVVSFGARSDGKTDSSKAFTKAWSWACSARAATVTLYVPRGTFVLKSLVFSGPCRSRIVFQIDGTLVAPSNYWDMGSSGHWIMFSKVNRMSLHGPGTLDARGHAFWACRRSSNGNCPPGARSISLSWCSNIVVNGLTSINSQTIHIAIDHCKNVVLRKVKIRAPSSSPNTDGILLQSSSSVTVTRSTIMTGDDCISIGSGCRDVWIERSNCGPGHGISIGSLGDSAKEEGVQNVTVTSCTFTKTQNGVRIKTWARPSNGYATNINFQNLIMNNVDNPIIIDQSYCPGGGGCPRQNSGVKISKVTYSNIVGTSGTKVAVKLDCSPSNPCWGIKLQNIKLIYQRKSPASLCAYARGSSSGIVIPRSCLNSN